VSDPAATPSAERYLVRPYGAGWRIVCDAGQSTTFAQAGEAIREACEAARRTALSGRLGLVVTETSPQEFHCFIPGPQGGATEGPPRTLPDYLRLIATGA
jgi:hypothetical protein